MEEHPGSHNEKKPITLNLDEFDLDSFELKPINKGLGFHGDRVLDKVVIRKTGVTDIGFGRSEQSAPLLTGNKFLQNRPQEHASAGLMNGVEAIYGTKKEKIKVKRTVKENIEPVLKEASYFNMITAFVIDLSIIIFTTLLLLVSFYYIGFHQLTMEGFQEFILESFIYVGLIFALCFLSYFSLLEPVGTIGKRSLSLQVCQSCSNGAVTIRQSFTRSFVTLLSLTLVGVPLILDFQSKLSGSRVIQQ